MFDRRGALLMKFLIALLFSTTAYAAVPDLAKAPLWADLDDVIHYTPNAMPDAPVINAAAKKDPRFTSGNSKFISGLHLEYQPAAAPAAGLTSYKAAAQMADNTGRLFYRKFLIDVDG